MGVPKPLWAISSGALAAQHKPSGVSLAARCSHCLFSIPCTFLKICPSSLEPPLDCGVKQKEGWTR